MSCNLESDRPTAGSCPGKPRNLKWTDCNARCNGNGPVPSDADQHLVFQTPVKQHRVIERKRFEPKDDGKDCTEYEFSVPNCVSQVEVTIVGGAGGGSQGRLDGSTPYTGAGGGAGYTTHAFLDVEPCGGTAARKIKICVGKGGEGGTASNMEVGQPVGSGHSGTASTLSYEDSTGVTYSFTSPGGCGGGRTDCVRALRLLAGPPLGGTAGAVDNTDPDTVAWLQANPGIGNHGANGKEVSLSDPCPSGGDGGRSQVGIPGIGGMPGVMPNGIDGTFGAGGGGGSYLHCPTGTPGVSGNGGYGGDGIVFIAYTRDATQALTA